LLIHSVCVYCGSSNHIDARYHDSAREVGAALALHKMRLIYGGGHVGLMGLVADAALAVGGEVVGIIPEYIRSHEMQHTGLTELHVVDNMHIRKDLMAEKADAFVALPGGFGTLDELFEILTWKQIGLHTKPIIIYNDQGFWDPMLGLIEHVIAGNFAPQNNRKIFKVVDNVNDMMTEIMTPESETFDPKDKWN